MRRVEIISHRGASGWRPEHTLASYELGARQGGDFMEPDLVATRDGHLIARHDAEIGHTTDVARRPEFADRRTTRTVDGQQVTGWFACDFTLAEIRTLRAVERLPDLRPDNIGYDGQLEIPTIEEIIELAIRLTAELGRPVGIYPETKHPTYHATAGLALEPMLIDALTRHGLLGPDPRVPVYLQSFEADSLRALRPTGLPLVYLMHDGPEYAPARTREGLVEVASFADAIGPDKSLVIPRDGDGRLAEPTSLVADAHAAGLLVHPYTFRSENHFLPTDLRVGGTGDYGDFAAEYRAFFAAGVDGVFTDHTAHAFEVRANHPTAE